MSDPIESMLADLVARYKQAVSSEPLERLYRDDEQFGHVFATLHHQLNEHFDSINGRAKSTRHYWADSSRQLLALMEEISETIEALKAAGFAVAFDPRYRAALDACEPWLSGSGGSTVPEDFAQIKLVKFEPVFIRPDTTVRLKKTHASLKLTMVGEGSYATVFSFIDPDYGIKIAVKRAKKDLQERDLERFRNEYEILRRLSFPYVIQVYGYNRERNEYQLEYCDATLGEYIAKRNANLSTVSRRRIALQLLYGINYLHREHLLHRDISLQNVLLKVYGSGAVQVKLSDFGLVKEESSKFTRTQTEMRGTIRDPMLNSFKDYAVVNEIYCLGWVLSYVFTGRDGLKSGNDEVGRIIQKCTTHEVAQRYQTVMELVADVERVDSDQPRAPVTASDTQLPGPEADA